MKRIVPILVIVVLAVGGGAFWWYRHDHQPATQSLTLFGNVDIRQVQLAFNASERIERLLVREGDAVKKGQLLATLSVLRLEQNVRLAQGQADAQGQQLARLEAGSRPEEIRKARADADAARADAENAAQVYKRQLALLERKFISEQQVASAKSITDAAQSRLASAREILRLAELGPRKEDIAAARAVLQANEAALALARRELADASLYAPADGVIQDRILEPGDMASPQRPVYTLALTDPIWVRAYAPGPDLGKLKPGMSAEVSTDSYPGKRYRGWIGYISPSAEFTPKAVETTEIRAGLVYQVRVFICNADNELRLGMPATVTIPLAPQPAAEPCKQP